MRVFIKAHARIKDGKAHRYYSLVESVRTARELRGMGAASVGIKGGHARGETADLFFDGDRTILFQEERLRTTSDHGTGCTFSAAIAAMLARGARPAEAVGEAKWYVTESMRSAAMLESGRGPLNHFHGWGGKG